MADYGGSLGTLVYNAGSAEDLGLEMAFNPVEKQKKGTWIHIVASTLSGAVSVEKHIPYVVEPWDISGHYSELEDALGCEMAKNGMLSNDAIVLSETRVFTSGGKLDFKESYQQRFNGEYFSCCSEKVRVEKESIDRFID